MGSTIDKPLNITRCLMLDRHTGHLRVASDLSRSHNSRHSSWNMWGWAHLFGTWIACTGRICSVQKHSGHWGSWAVGSPAVAISRETRSVVQLLNRNEAWSFCLSVVFGIRGWKVEVIVEDICHQELRAESLYIYAWSPRWYHEPSTRQTTKLTKTTMQSGHDKGEEHNKGINSIIVER